MLVASPELLAMISCIVYLLKRFSIYDLQFKIIAPLFEGADDVIGETLLNLCPCYWRLMK